MSGSNPTFKALLWMMGAVVSFTLMAISGRAILLEINTFELMLYRSIIGVLIVSFALSRSNRGFSQLKTAIPAQHLIRSIVHFTGQNLWLYAVAIIPLAQLVALEFTNPLWVALLAPLLLGERLTRQKFIIVIMGFIGVLIVARPGVEPLNLGHLAAILAAIGFALTNIATRRIMRHDTVLTLLFWMTLSQAVMSFFLSLPGGIPWPEPALWPWIFIMGITGLSAHYCLTQALNIAPATTVAPMDFIRLPISAVVGVMLYQEPLLITVFIGGAIILFANYLNLKQKN
ncbi:MAG: DMT family transporter [Rhodobacteraceae bacterium]|nr:DMT family transporter [Paracoccaceae bacterium]